MPKLKKVRSKIVRTNFSTPKFVGCIPKMATSSLGSAAATHSNEPISLENLADNLVFFVAARQKPAQIKGFEDELLCSNCSNLLYHPATARCGHSFCIRCCEESTFCRHCKRNRQWSSLSKPNVVLNTIVEHWCPGQYALLELVSEGDRLLKIGSFLAAESKFSEAMEKNPYDIFSITRRALARKEAGKWEDALADIVSAKIRSKFIPEESKANADDFSLIAAQEESTVQKTVKMFLGVASLLDSHAATQSEISSCGTDIRGFFAKCSAEDFLGDISSVPSSPRKDGSSFIKTQFVSEEKLAELDNALDAIISGNICDFQTFLWGVSTEPKRASGHLTTRDSEDYADDFSCVLCTRPFHEPVCTPCGHTYCFDCLERCFDHGRSCPMCKTPLKEMFQYQKCLSSVDWSVDSILKKYLPNLWKNSAALRQQEKDKLRETLPVFVCTVAFPSVPCNLHVFEPRYRLMIRRAQRVHDGSFGITIPSPTAPFHAIGTIIKLDKVSFYQDGRSLVSSVGTKRFEVQEYSTCDGYNTAKVKYIVDEQEMEQNDVKEIKKMATEIYENASKWYSSCPGQFKSVVKRNFGDFPEQDEAQGENGPNWPWWLLAVLPVNDDVKVYVLGKNRLRARLAVLNLILRKMQSSDQN